MGHKHSRTCIIPWLVREGCLPESTVYLRASWATMLARPLRMVSRALPSSIRYLASHARQYCSWLRARVVHGALNVPEENTGRYKAASTIGCGS